ncbi:cytochrome P450 [Actinoplanes sichuanensis]|uniref:Cytochrome P450 n=1 Tax=Actinoplanes sichuanensis TaxID=512349 RepID=A0ABW4ALL5_9ACTN|nr:cytochrome P450 [Actinoplanes sichuanensis]BEL06126.1 cytochrome P450 [Actinoplanes sichuanensis]
MDVTATTYPFTRHRPFEMPHEFAWLRANAPITQVKLAGGEPAWLITRYDDVRAALSDPRFARTPPQAPAAPMDAGFPVDASSPVFSFGSSISEPPGHTRWRRIVNKAFTQRQADTMRPLIRQHTDAVLDDMAARDRHADLMDDFAYRLPLRIICELLGIPDQDRPEFTTLASGLTRRDPQTSFAEFGTTMQGIGRYAATLIGRKRRDLGDDLLSTLITLPDDDDSRLSNEELVSTVILLLMAGYESTAVQFGNAFFALFQNPDQLARLRAEPELVDTAVEEILRWAQMGTGFAVAKFAATDITLGEVTIPTGATVFVSIASADRDSAQFGADAELFDVARRTATRHLAFSNGPHYCLGAALARAELREGLSGVLGRFPDLRLDGSLTDVELAANLFTFYPRNLPVTW